MDYTRKIETELADSDNLKIGFKVYFRFWSFVVKKQLLAFIGYGLFLVFMSSLTPFFTYMWKQYIDSATTNQPLHNSLIMVSIYIIIKIIVDFCYFFSMRFMDNINFSSWRVLDSSINKKSTSIKNEYFEIPNIQNKINRAWEFNHGSYIQLYQLGLDALRQLVQLIGIFISLFLISPFVCLISLLAIIPAIVSKFIKDKLTFYNSRNLSDDENELNYYRSAIFDQSLLKEIILKFAFPFFQNKYEKKAQQVFDKKMKIEIKKSKLTLLDELISNSIILLCILFSSYKLIVGDISIGGMAVIFTLILTLVYTLTSFVANGCSVFTLTYNIKQFYEFIDLDTLMNEEKNKELDTDVNDIVFKDVNYRYPLTDNYVISSLDIKIKKGQHIAVVGANGSGKSTFIKLILKLIEPSSGEIYFGKENLKNINSEKYWRSFASVFQDFNKHKESLRYNVGIGNTEDIENKQKLNNVLSIAEFDKNIELDCMLSKEFGGIELSGGEWQKIAIARSLLKNCNIYILDEPTAAIDPIREAELYKKFFEICKDKTSIFVTHRLGSVLYSDIVLFFKDGRITESGSHEELLSLNGEYAKFWFTQAEMYI